ncbi:MAG: CPBP family intramembrane metalloprotease [Trueperaceae bacterium]|nr:CPBP family intramembrane metalloprotease [Trueperaceae bacterium]
MARDRGLGLFFVLAFALPWAVWGTTIAQQRGIISWHVPSSLAFWLGLTIATFGAAALTGGWPALRDVLLRMVRARVAWRWYAVALLLTPVIAMVSALVGRSVGAPTHVGDTVGAAGLPGLLALNVWLFLLTEEAAWRGFALPRLQARSTPLTAALLLGLVWGVWHLPLFLTRGTFQAGLPFAGFMASIVATSVMVSWLYNHTRGSVLLAAIFHAATDVTIAYSGVMNSGGALFWLFVAAQCLVAAVLGAGMLERVPRSGPLVYEPVR